MPKLSGTHLTKRSVEAAPLGKYAWDNEVRGFGVRVTPAGARSFVYRHKFEEDRDDFRNKGVKQRQRFLLIGSFPAMTVEQARNIARAYAAERGTDHLGIKEKAAEEERNAPTLARLEVYYLGEYAEARNLKPKTLRDARGVLQLVPADMKTRKVADVTKPDVRGLHGQARKTSGVYQANRLLAVLSKMFALAIENGWRKDDVNPCRGVSKFSEDQRWRNLKDAEVARLLEACDRYNGRGRAWRKEGIEGTVWEHNAADAVRLLLFTGARLQEVLKAEWSEFDLDVGLWNKPSSHTKTKRQHRLELDGPALELCRDMRERDPDGRFLFPGEPGRKEMGKPIERARADLKRPWAWIAKEAGLEGVRLHDLRRTMASFMLSDGASLATVGKTLGHTQAATTQRYAHLSQTVQREGMKRAGERMAALKGTAPKGKVLVLVKQA